MLLIIIAGGFFFYHDQKERSVEQNKRKPLVGDLQKELVVKDLIREKITRLEYKKPRWKKEIVPLANKLVNDSLAPVSWEVLDFGNIPTDSEAVEKLLNSVFSLREENTIDDQKLLENKALFGLDKPELTIVFNLGKENQQTLNFGKEIVVSERRYVEYQGHVFLVSENSFQELNRDQDYFYEKQPFLFLKPEFVEKITIEKNIQNSSANSTTEPFEIYSIKRLEKSGVVFWQLSFVDQKNSTSEVQTVNIASKDMDSWLSHLSGLTVVTYEESLEVTEADSIFRVDISLVSGAQMLFIIGSELAEANTGLLKNDTKPPRMGIIDLGKGPLKAILSDFALDKINVDKNFFIKSKSKKSPIDK